MKATICLLISLSVILITEAGHNPKMNVDFGINLPSMSFNLPGMAMPKMRITAVVNRSKPKKPMKIELPAISLHAKSLEDPWGQSGGSEYSSGGAGGYSSADNGGAYGGAAGGGGGGYSAGTGGSDSWSDGGSNNGYASENDEEYSSEGHSEDGYDDDNDSYEAPQSGYSANNNNNYNSGNNYNQGNHQSYGQAPAQQNNYNLGANVQSGYGQAPVQQNSYGAQPGYNQHQPQEYGNQGYNQQQNHYQQQSQYHQPPQYNQQPQYNQNQEYNHQVLKYGPPRPDQDYGNQGANYPQAQSGYGSSNQGGYGNNQGSYGGQGEYNQDSYGSNHGNYGPNYAEGKELYVYGQTPKKVRFYEDKYASSGYNNNNNNNYQRDYGQANQADYSSNSPTSVTLSTGYKSQPASNQQQSPNSSWKPVAGSSYYGYQ